VLIQCVAEQEYIRLIVFDNKNSCGSQVLHVCNVDAESWRVLQLVTGRCWIT
jgi:ribulose bisphosphate carboxylase small subunit